MILFPNCKINLGLYILRKREDGFHDLETVFYPVPLQDALEIVQAEKTDKDVSINITGLSIDGGPAQNICVKAYDLLKKDFPEIPPVQLHLHKAIPTGAGLGGGSADGAFTLLLLNQKFNLQLPEEALIRYALQLGSDCPFFIKNKPCFATGRGEGLQEINLDLSAYKMVLVNPGIHIATGWAFSQLTPFDRRPSLCSIVQQPVTEWKDKLVNDFETPIFSRHPEIGKIKEELYGQGAVYAAMSGSGSTVFGLFEKEVAINKEIFSPSFFIHTIG